MLGKYNLECPMCYVENSMQLNICTGVVKCKECGELFTNLLINIEEGKAVEVILEPLGGKMYER